MINVDGDMLLVFASQNLQGSLIYPVVYWAYTCSEYVHLDYG